MNLVDALLRESGLLWKPIVILLHPTVEQTLTTSIQEVYRLDLWPGVPEIQGHDV